MAQVLHPVHCHGAYFSTGHLANLSQLRKMTFLIYETTIRTRNLVLLILVFTGCLSMYECFFTIPGQYEMGLTFSYKSASPDERFWNLLGISLITWLVGTSKSEATSELNQASFFYCTKKKIRGNKSHQGIRYL